MNDSSIESVGNDNSDEKESDDKGDGDTAPLTLTHSLFIYPTIISSSSSSHSISPCSF